MTEHVLEPHKTAEKIAVAYTIIAGVCKSDEMLPVLELNIDEHSMNAFYLIVFLTAISDFIRQAFKIVN
jgi:hypothetical protein